MKFIDQELGIFFEADGEWKVENSSDGREVLFSKGKSAVLIVRGGRLRLEEAMERLAARGMDFREAKIKECPTYAIAFVNIPESAVKVEVFKPSVGMDDVRIRVRSPKAKWYITVPSNWKVEEIGEFGDGVTFGAGRIKGWILFFPTTGLIKLRDYVKKRLLALIGNSKLEIIKEEAGENWASIEAYVELTGVKRKVALWAKKILVTGDIDERYQVNFPAIAESGYFTPAHVEKGAEQILNSVFSSFNLGVNFMLEYIRMSNSERIIRALALESALLKTDVCEIIERFMESANSIASKLAPP